MDDKLDIIINKIGQLEAGQKEMMASQRLFETKLNGFESKLDSFESKLDSFESKLDSFESRLDSFEVAQQEMITRQNSFEVRLITIEAGQKELNLICTSIRDRQDETDAHLEALTVQFHRFEGNMNRIEVKLDNHIHETRGDLQFLNHRVADLEIEVDKLKRR